MNHEQGNDYHLSALRSSFKVQSFTRCGQLNGFLDFAAAETARADPNALWLTVDQCPDWLEVGLEDPLGLVIGVTDVIAGLATFATEITCKCHGCTPSSSRIDMKLLS